ncbi:FAD-dependent monooxygenase [Actinoplanes sp. NPDC051851]|uniref:FAD-dependent monooxygenase n=1 Tax=Actinoplanes sp. NPDC051851 TaxID=3154753 RepID=UPI003412B6D2
MHDVVIAGAGPVGLLLAGELALAGCDVLVLEREPAAATPVKAMPLGMRGLSAASVEALYRRGMLADMGVADVDAPIRPRHVGHFAGMMLNATLVGDLPYRLPSPALEGMMTSLEQVESVLAARAVDFGAEIRYGIEVSEIDPRDDGVLVNGAIPARWLVGCDGGRGAVRRLAGFSRVGTAPRFTGYIALATIPDLDKLRPGFNLTPTGMYLRMHVDGHVGMMDFDGGAFDRSRPPTREHLQSVLRHVSGTDVTLTELHQVSTFTDRSVQATAYRKGRILLAGDAAHIHSPLGGQGLNLGIGDAMNLGWKLAATVRGHAPDGLLDTYESERHPVGARVLNWSRAQVETMSPGPHAAALQAFVGDLLATGDGVTYAYERLSGQANRYDLGSDDPLVGRNAPDFRLKDGTRLGDLLHSGHGVLLDFTPSALFRDAAEPWSARIRYACGPAVDDLGLRAVLVRPDGVVAWTDARDDVGTAAARWFGRE